MNKLMKIIVAILGGVNTMFSIATPILLVLLIMNSVVSLSELNQWTLLTIGILASMYRALKLWII